MNGNLLKVISKNAGTINRTFDALNRVKTYTDAKENTVSYDYDQSGNLVKLTYPNGQAITYQYDRAGLLTDVIDFSGSVTHYEYDNNSRVTTVTRPNGTKKVTTYDDAGQVKTVLDTNAQGEIISQYAYDYDAAGNLTTETGLNEDPALTSGEIIMTYGKGNRLETYNGESVKYDADGNMTYGPLNGEMVSFRYDARNRLIEAGSTTYLYDAENNRIGMIENGQETDYVINPHASLSQVIQAKKGDKVTQYIYGTGLILQVTGGEYATYHYDNRGSTVAITNGTGKVTDTFTYAPYGELLERTGKTDTPFLYNGMYGVETDDNGLYCMRSRYYNPTIKRFINQDVVQGSLDNAVTLNRYAYANGNPVDKLDPYGIFTLTLATIGTIALVGAAICAISAVVVHHYSKSSSVRLPKVSLGTYGLQFDRDRSSPESSKGGGIFTPDFEEVPDYSNGPDLEYSEPRSNVETFPTADAGGINVVTQGAGNTNTTRVGRWMSQAEYDNMVKTGKVQMSPNGNTAYVANPADINVFGKQAKPGSIYAEFDVDTNSIFKAGTDGWGQIGGSGSLQDRYNKLKGLPPITEMPDATNIQIKGKK